MHTKIKGFFLNIGVGDFSLNPKTVVFLKHPLNHHEILKNFHCIYHPDDDDDHERMIDCEVELQEGSKSPQDSRCTLLNT